MVEIREELARCSLADFHAFGESGSKPVFLTSHCSSEITDRPYSEMSVCIIRVIN